jgi:hypothetical protein
LDSNSDDLVTAPFEHDARQRARRRTLQHVAGANREIATLS